MARSSARTRQQSNTENTEINTENTEIPEGNTMTDTATDTTDQPTEEAPKAPVAEIDLSNFTSVVESAVAERDMSTGTLPVEQVELVRAAYRELVGGVKARNAARKDLQERLKDAVGRLDVVEGKAVMELAESLASTPAASTASPVDPSVAFKLRLTAAHLAYTLVANDAPEGVDGDKVLAEVGDEVDGLTDAAATYYQWLSSTEKDRGDEPQVPTPVRLGAKMASSLTARVAKKRATNSTGVRGNVLKHILTVVDGIESGTFLRLGEIAQAKSPEYPDGTVSPGAVSARLFPADDGGKGVHADLLAVVTPTRNASGRKGVTVN